MPRESPIFLYLAGTAGSGKTKLTHGFERWMDQEGLDAITVNLDPGARRLPYDPAVDIRDWVVLDEVMDEYGLGPNGAQVVAADMLALQIGNVKQAIQEFRTDVVLLDTPGQLELFVFRDAGRVAVNALGPQTSMLAFLVDPYLARTPSSFVSQLLLAANTQFRFKVPQVNVLSKVDLLDDEGKGESDLDVDRETITTWAEDLDRLYDDLVERDATPYNQLNTDIFRVIEDMGTYTDLTPVSGETLEGVEDLYAHAIQNFRGGEDIRPD
jgi:GTPase SAR1 family protein